MDEAMARNFWRIAGTMIRRANDSGQMTLRRYKSLFGVSPEVTSVAWRMAEEKRPPSTRPMHLLWCLIFLKVYGSEAVNAFIAGVDEKTFRKWCWIWVQILSQLNVICWSRRFEQSQSTDRAFVSLDGVDFRIYEQTPFDRKWFSHKFHGPGLRYEVGVCIRTGMIVWTHGGYPCGDWPDLRLARDAYINCVNHGEITYADKGYRDATYFYFPTATMQNPRQHKEIMARHETVNKRMKQFKVLSSVFRHAVHLHPRCFHAVANLTQISLENGEPLYSL